MDDVLIVGAGVGGYRAALALRMGGYEGALTMVGDEPHYPYDRPPLSKQILDGSFETDRLYFQVAGLDVTWRLGLAATTLDRGSRGVTLSDGSAVSYDRLIVATGRAARRTANSDHVAGIHVIRRLDDALALRKAAAPESEVVIVGAGFIGCEVAATLRSRGVRNVTLIDIAPHPMSALGPEVGQRCAASHRDHGVRLVMGHGVAEYLVDAGQVVGVRLDSGESVPAEVVVLGLGSVANTGWLVDSGLALDHGNVVCDEYLFAVDSPDILAIGDIALVPRRAVGGRLCTEHWTSARQMAELAAHNLLAPLDRRRPFAAVPTFWSDQYDLHIKSVGYPSAADTFEVIEEDVAAPSLVVEARRGGRLVGAITINRNRQMIEYVRRLSSEDVAISAPG